MKRRSVALLLGIVCVVAIVVGVRYMGYVQRQDFTLIVDAPCDPAQHQCFVSDCSPTDDPGCDTSPYAKVAVTARFAPACLEEHTCSTFSCEGRAECHMTFCTADALESGERCSQP